MSNLTDSVRSLRWDREPMFSKRQEAIISSIESLESQLAAAKAMLEQLAKPMYIIEGGATDINEDWEARIEYAREGLEELK